MSSSLRASARQPVREEGTRPGPVYRPDADILERADEYLVRVDVPGADEGSVEVRFEQGVLSIEARPSAARDPGWRPIHAEYEPGAFAREFRLGEGIDVDSIRASLANGVLELHLPKTERRRSRTIEVAAS
jgi:HSP20 family protein